MQRSSVSQAAAFSMVFVGALAAAPNTVRAQSGDGFLFRRPVATLAIRGGYDRALAGSDVFRDLTNRLTLDRGDFGAPSVGADLALTVSDRVDVVLSSGFTRRSTDSEYRRFVAEDDTPISQNTTFTRVPVTATARYYLAPRGARVGNFAWVPAKFAPYVGAGAGGTWYRLRQDGEFLNESALRTFVGDVESSGWAPTGVASAGVDVSLAPRFLVTGEARYSLARARLKSGDGGFNGYAPADLSGIALTAGVAVRF
jgi:outer membrane protein W